MNYEEIIKLRRKLHKSAELSHKEKKTSEIIEEYISEFNPDKIYKIENGLLFIFGSGKKGETVVFRTDMDALPIPEDTGCPYSSEKAGVSHSCGHDGHMAVMCGLAEKISKNRPERGNAVLLFQPAEEVGEGAEMIVKDPVMKTIAPDRFFGLHNIPGYPAGSVIIKNNSFACATKGMTIRLLGKTSHAGEPQNGISPVNAVKELIVKMNELKDDDTVFRGFALITVIHIKVGEEAFGTSPGYGEFMVTLRTEFNDDMEKMVCNCEKIVKDTAQSEHLKYEIGYREIFPAVINDEVSYNYVKNSANKNGLEIIELKEPFKWSEDFSYYTQKYQGAFFGLGSGTEHPALHNPDYDFPDEIIDKGVDMFYQIYKSILR